MEIRILVTWLKSSLLMMIKYFHAHIYIKTQCLQTNKTQYYLWEEKALVVGGISDRVGIN